MISFEVNITPAPILSALTYDALVKKLQTDAGAEFTASQAPFLDLVETYPTEPNRPIEWLSERQRKAARARIRREQGTIAYTRQYRLRAGWDYTFTPLPGGVRLTAANATWYAPYVYGDLSFTLPIARQQPFHRITGWQPVGFLIGQFFEQVARRTAVRFVTP